MSRFGLPDAAVVDRSRAEVHKLLRRYGATRIADAWEPSRAAIQFEIEDTVVRLSVPIPTTEEIRKRPRARKSPAALRKAVEQAERQRWRALALLLKAKLEACAMGLTTFENEFLEGLVLRNGSTVGEQVRGELEAADRDWLLALPAKGETSS